MAHVVVIAGWYYPNPSPTGNCIRKIVDQLKKEHTVSVVCFSQGETNASIVVDGVRIYSIGNLRLRLRFYALNGLKSDAMCRIRTYYFKTLFFFSRVLRAVQSTYSWPSSEKWFIAGALQALQEIDEQIPIDVLLTVSNPFEAHVSGLIFKRKNSDVNWITYTLDHFTNADSLHKFSLCKRLKRIRNRSFESRVFNSADVNFITEGLVDWCRGLVSDYDSSFVEISFPLLSMDTSYTGSKYIFNGRHDSINVVYAGTFYRQIRNPEYLLRLFSATRDERLVLHVFSSGDCNDIVRRYAEDSGGRIVQHGFLPTSEIRLVLHSADVLVNVGNTISEQIPSKIFEYIATGKPIVNLYHGKNSYNNIFSKYPLSLSFAQNHSDLEAKAYLFEQFCVSIAGESVSPRYLMDQFKESTPEYISGLFNSYILKKGANCIG